MMKKPIVLIICLFLVICFASTGIAYAKIVKAKSVTLNIKEATIGVKATVVLTASQKPAKAKEALSWSSSDENVATVSKTGVVTGITEGNAVITVKTAKSKKTANCRIRVDKYLTTTEAADLLADKITKDETLVLIKNNTLSRDDTVSLIRQYGSSGGLSSSDVIRLIKQYAKIATAKEDITVIPGHSCVYKSAEYLHGNDRPYPRIDVNVNNVQVRSVKEKSYEEFLAMDKSNGALDRSEVYWKYSTSVAFSGSVDASHSGEYVRFEFSGNYDDREWFSSAFAQIGSDGSFSGVCDLQTNYIPSEITLVYIDVWEGIDED